MLMNSWLRSTFESSSAPPTTRPVPKSSGEAISGVPGEEWHVIESPDQAIGVPDNAVPVAGTIVYV